MSDGKLEIVQDIDTMELEVKIAEAKAAIAGINLRIAKRERENQKDLEHVGLQMKSIKECEAKIATLKKP